MATTRKKVKRETFFYNDTTVPPEKVKHGETTLQEDEALVIDRIDWDSIEIDFVKGIPINGDEKSPDRTYPTFKELSKKYNLTPEAIESKCHREGWLDERKEFAERLKQMRALQTRDGIRDHLNKVNVEILDFLGRAEKMVEAMSLKAINEGDYNATDKWGKTLERFHGLTMKVCYYASTSIEESDTNINISDDLIKKAIEISVDDFKGSEDTEKEDINET